MGVGANVAAAAEQLLGCPFTLHGRDPATGLDCIGLVLTALSHAGRRGPPAAGYRLRRSDIGSLLALAGEWGLDAVSGAIEPGDILLVHPGPAQNHLLVASRAGGFVHAHAGLRRVVRSPAPLPWPVLHHWRLQG